MCRDIVTREEIANLSVSFSALVIVYVHSTVGHLRRVYVCDTHSICDEPCGSCMPPGYKSRRAGIPFKRSAFIPSAVINSVDGGIYSH